MSYQVADSSYPATGPPGYNAQYAKHVTSHLIPVLAKKIGQLILALSDSFFEPHTLGSSEGKCEERF
jgi:hypothetical protein